MTESEFKDAVDSYWHDFIDEDVGITVTKEEEAEYFDAVLNDTVPAVTTFTIKY